MSAAVERMDDHMSCDSDGSASSDHQEPASVDMKEEEGEDEEDCFYVNKPQFIQAARMLIKYGRVILLGPPGSGKTYLAHALIKFFRQKGYIPKFGMPLCDACSTPMMKEGGPKRIVLMELGFDALRADPSMGQEQLHDFLSRTLTLVNSRTEFNGLFIVTVYPHVLRDLENAEFGRMRDEKILTHPQTILRMTRDPLDPTLPYVPGPDNLMPFLTRLLRGVTTGNAFSCLLALSLGGFWNFNSTDKEKVQAEMRRLGLGTLVTCQQLDYFSRTMQGLIFDPKQEDHFLSRAVYDACALALVHTGATDLVLRVCDARFLIDRVRLEKKKDLTTPTTSSFPSSSSTTSSSSSSSTTTTPPSSSSTTTLVISAPYQRDLVMDRMSRLIQEKNGSREIPQHPSLGEPEVVAELFQYCEQTEAGLAQKLMMVGDTDFNLPLLYWALWAPTPYLAQWCLDHAPDTLVPQDAADLQETVVSSIVACMLVKALGDPLLESVRALVKTLHKLPLKQTEAALVNLTLPLPSYCSTPEVQATVDRVRWRVQTMGLCYLNDPNMPIPAKLMTLAVSDSQDSLHLTMATKTCYLTLRLLTDADKDETDSDMDTVPHLALATDDDEIIAIAMKAGGSLTIKNKKGQTAKDMDDERKRIKAEQQRKILEEQRRKEEEERRKKEEIERKRQAQIAEQQARMKKNKAKASLPPIYDSAKNTALHMACREGRADTVALLLQLKAEVNAQNSERQTPLWLASTAGHVECVRLLIRAKANVRLPDKHLSSPLHEACKRDLADVAAELVSAGADVNGEDKNGMTPIYLTSAAGHTDILQRLLQEAYASVNLTKAPEGRTPLHAACEGGHSEVVTLLLQKGADVNLKDARGRTPADIVRQQGLQGPAFQKVLEGSN